MSDEGEKMCPLCTEEMDLTDQQLKPCKCGYEICVWCWHHIMEMAEKDETEARCPACRTLYDKEKIVGTAANCERRVAGVSMEKKKSQKAKVKTSEGRKQLSSARVIQRNLVYIVGLPLNLADEDLLLHKEYFGQYGKVLKVSVSRTSGGAIQQFPNNSCSVYITYAKEEEAIRCIQSINGFTLEGRSLRACFGTTKYCHAWLRNALCTNPDCLYLHEIGSHENSFTKDEIISAYSRVQQITGITNNVQRQSGNVLPPPIDDYCHNSSVTTTKPIPKSTPNNLANSDRISPPTSSAGRNCALPVAASWGTRASNGQSSAGSMVCSNGPAKQKPVAAGAPVAFSAAVAGKPQTSFQCSDKKAVLNDNSHPKELEYKPRLPENTKQLAKDLQTNLSDKCQTPLVTQTAPIATGRKPSSSVTMASIKSRHSAEEQSNMVDAEKVRAFVSGEKNHKLCPDAAPVSVDKLLTGQNSEVTTSNCLSLDCFLVARDKGLQHFDDAKLQEQMASPVLGKDATSTVSGNKQLTCQNSEVAISNDLSLDCFLVAREKGLQQFDDAKLQEQMASPVLGKDATSTVSGNKQLTCQNSEVAISNDLSLDCFLVPREKGLQQFDDAKLQEQMASPGVGKYATSTDGAGDLRSDMQSSAMLNLPSEKEKGFEIQGASHSTVPQTSLPTSVHSFDLLKYLRNPSQQHSDTAAGVINHNIYPAVNKQDEEHLAALASHPSFASYGLGDDQLQCTSGIINPSVLPDGLQGNRMLTSDNVAANVDLNPCLDVMESSIISNMLSLDLDAWDDSITSPQNLVKLLGENERRQGSFNLASCKSQNSNQSRFSFARQEESRNHLFDVEPSSNINTVIAPSFGPAFINREPYLNRLGNGFGIPHHNVEQYDGFGSSQSVFPANKLSVSRAQISAPPGFSVPSKSPPPGFSLKGRSDPSVDMKSGNYFLETTSRDPYIQSPNVSSSNVMDMEFIDPAILAVGKGRPSSSFSYSNVDVRPALSSESSVFESDEARLHLLMQRSFQPHQNLRHADVADKYSPSDAHVYSSRHLESSQVGNLSLFPQFGLQPRGAMSNGLWDKWPEVMAGNNVGMEELLRNDRLSFNQFYGGYEESKFQMPNSGNLYNRTFGM